MKRFIIAATALTLTAPAALAQTPVENPCAFFNQSVSVGERVDCDLQNTGISAEGAEILSDISEQDDMGEPLTAAQIIDDDRGVVNAEAAEIFDEIADEQDGSI
jgi:hypothetical protein